MSGAGYSFIPIDTTFQELFINDIKHVFVHIKNATVSNKIEILGDTLNYDLNHEAGIWTFKPKLFEKIFFNSIRKIELIKPKQDIPHFTKTLVHTYAITLKENAKKKLKISIYSEKRLLWGEIKHDDKWYRILFSIKGNELLAEIYNKLTKHFTYDDK